MHKPMAVRARAAWDQTQGGCGWAGLSSEHTAHLPPNQEDFSSPTQGQSFASASILPLILKPSAGGYQPDRPAPSISFHRELVCENRFGGGFQPPFPPAVAHSLLLSALTAVIE